jgi:hypothetical protein
MANPNRQDNPEIKRSEQGVLNNSFDEQYQVLATEMLVENEAGTALVRLNDSNFGGSSSSTSGGATEAQQVAQGETLEEIEHAVQSIASARGIASDLRVTLLGGTTAVTGSLTSAGTVSTVTTVTTVAGLTNIGGLPAQSLITSTNNTNAVLSNINNVSV